MTEAFDNGNSNTGDWSTASTLGAGVLVVVGAGLVLFLVRAVLPDVQRYMKMRSM